MNPVAESVDSELEMQLVQKVCPSGWAGHVTFPRTEHYISGDCYCISPETNNNSISREVA